jgi:hypothetical protein
MVVPASLTPFLPAKENSWYGFLIVERSILHLNERTILSLNIQAFNSERGATCNNDDQYKQN